MIIPFPPKLRSVYKADLKDDGGRVSEDKYVEKQQNAALHCPESESPDVFVIGAQQPITQVRWLECSMHT